MKKVVEVIYSVPGSSVLNDPSHRIHEVVKEYLAIDGRFDFSSYRVSWDASESWQKGANKIEYEASDDELYGSDTSLLNTLRMKSFLSSGSRVVFITNDGEIWGREAFGSGAEVKLISKTQSSSGSSNSNGGCFVATYVYGGYNKPQVFILRRFRDSILIKYKFGRRFVGFYYAMSPGWVEKAKENRLIAYLLKLLVVTLVAVLRILRF